MTTHKTLINNIKIYYFPVLLRNNWHTSGIIIFKRRAWWKRLKVKEDEEWVQGDSGMGAGRVLGESSASGGH